MSVQRFGSASGHRRDVRAVAHLFDLARYAMPHEEEMHHGGFH
ncbi:MAG TPA: hypothetical protein VF041_20320 [Gemmatimonadaceae bacterium]